MRLVALGEVAQIVAGQSPPGETYNSDRVGLPFFQGKVDFGRRHPVARVWCSAPERTAEPGDILISVRAPVGPTNVADVRCCIGRGLAAIRVTASLDRDYLLYVLRWRERGLASIGSGSTFSAITRSDLNSLSVPLLSLADQRLVAGRLTEQLAAVEPARAAARERRRGSESLVTTTLSSLTTNLLAAWPAQPLGELGQMRPSPSASTDGDVEITAVTSGCLAPMGFDPSGLRRNRMPAAGAAVGIVRQGEVLIARSNTQAFVGRAALYDGAPPAVTVTDLAFRVAADPARLDAEYLARFLAGLQLTGYWRDRSSGASSTMKKITRRQLLSLPIPVPPLVEQRRVAAEVRERLATIDAMTKAIQDEFEAIEALPASLLRRAFEQVDDAA